MGLAAAGRAGSSLFSTPRVSPERGIAGVPTQGGGSGSMRRLCGGDIAVCVFLRSLPVYRKRATPGLAAVCIHRSQLSNYTGLICHSYVKRIFFCASIVPICGKAVVRDICGSNRGGTWPPAASLTAHRGSERLFQRFRRKGGVAGRDRPVCGLQAPWRDGSTSSSVFSFQ